MRTLDDVYGEDRDRFPLEQEARFRLTRLQWDEDDGEEDEYAYLLEAPRHEAVTSARR